MNFKYLKKKIKQFIYKLLGNITSILLKVIFLTIKISEETHSEFDKKAQYIFSFWHNKLLLCIKIFARFNRDTTGLVSPSAIGDILSHYIGKKGVDLIRGSSTRGGIAGLKALIGAAKRDYHLGLAPDGPRGPKLKASPGILYLAYKTGLPIIPIGVAYSKKWVVKSSWDHFNFPLPFSKAVIYAGKPIWVTSRDNIEADLERLHQAMHQSELKAESLLALKQTSQNRHITLTD